MVSLVVCSNGNGGVPLYRFIVRPFGMEELVVVTPLQCPPSVGTGMGRRSGAWRSSWTCWRGAGRCQSMRTLSGRAMALRRSSEGDGEDSVRWDSRACLGAAVRGGDHVGVRWARALASVTGFAGGEHGHGEHVLAQHGLGLPLLLWARARV